MANLKISEEANAQLPLDGSEAIRGVQGGVNVQIPSSAFKGYSGSRGAGYTGSQSEELGYTGSIGYTGSQGVGYTGSIGSWGYTGSQGVGYTGSKGYAGSQGVGYTGSWGYAGSQGTGYVGSKGDPGGYTGSRGVQGYTGSTAPAGSSSMTSNGYSNLPGGLILQWGWLSATSSGAVATFSIPFPTACLQCVATANQTSSNGAFVFAINTTAANIGVKSVTSNVFYMAVGN